MSDSEPQLEQEFRRVLDPLKAMPVPPRRVVAGRSASKAIFGGAGAALGLKLATGVAVAAAALTVAGVSTTGSLNPADWGQQVKQQVETCKDQLAAGEHGIGECVSDFASQHGATVASDARHHGNPNSNGATKGNSGGNGNGNGQGQEKGKDTTKDNPNHPPTERDPVDPSSHPPTNIKAGP